MSTNNSNPLAVIFVGNTHTFYAALATLKKEKIETKDTLLLINSRQLSENTINQKIWFDVKFLGIKKKETFSGKFFNKFKNRFIHIIWAIKSKAILDSLDTKDVICFIAAHYNWISHTSSFHQIKNKNKKFIVIDDGMKNIILEKLRTDELLQKKPNILYMEGYKKYSSIEKLLLRAVCKLIGLNISSVPILHWYTKLPTSSFSHKTKDIIIDISEKPSIGKTDKKTAHFISQPILGLGNIDIELLSQIYKSIRKIINKETEIIYIPHQIEQEQQKNLASEYFKIHPKTNMPYEIFYSKLKIKPGIIISFYSSVLFTLHREIENNISFYAIDCLKIDFIQEKKYRYLYKAMNDSGHINLIQINIENH